MFKVKYKDTRTTGIDKIFHYEVNEKNFLRWILRIDLITQISEFAKTYPNKINKF